MNVKMVFFKSLWHLCVKQLLKEELVMLALNLCFISLCFLNYPSKYVATPELF